MSLAVIDEQILHDLGDAIRLKNESQNTYLPSEMPTAVSNLNTSPNAFKQICLGIPVNFTPAEVDGISRVEDYLMYKIRYVNKVEFPSTVTYIGTFYDSSVTSLKIDLPLLSQVGNNAFSNMHSLTTAYINLPNVNNNYSFLSNANLLTHLDLVGIGAMGELFIFGAPKLPYVEIPTMCSSIGARSFDIAMSDIRSSVTIHIVFLRHTTVDESGSYIIAPPTFGKNLFGYRQSSKVFLHVPLDSLLAYRRNLLDSGSENATMITRIFVYYDAKIGDTLPSSISQIANGWEGTYNIVWYTDESHTSIYSDSTADQDARYYGVITVVNEEPIQN